MAGLQSFRQYLISQNREEGTVELWRNDDEVACLAVDTDRRVFVELHVAIAPPERQRNPVLFQRLVRTLIPLRHRNLPVIHEGGEDDGSAYYVSDVLAGERLDAWLERCGPLPEWLALHVAEQIAAGLRALAPHPQILAGVNPLHAGVAMTGDFREDLTVRLCDIGLMVERGVREGPREIEARLIAEVGNLLQRMVAGSPGAEPDLPVTAEMRFLIDTILRTDAPHHPRTVEQLHLLLARGRRELAGGNVIPPDRIPPRFQPGVPLREHFPGPSAVQDAVGDDFTVDPNSWDASRPWQLHAIRRSTRQPVIVQVLPPPNLLPAEYFAPAIRAAVQRAEDDAGHPLKLVEWHEEAGVLIEEPAGRSTAASLVRDRGGLEIGDVVRLLEQLNEAVSAADEAGLAVRWRNPSDIVVAFPDGGPGGGSGRDRDGFRPRPEEALPPFSVRLRTWPVTSWFVQPDLQAGAHLSVPGFGDGGMTGDPGSDGHDCAVLAAWLAGGMARLPDAFKPLFLEWTGKHAPEGTRADFLRDLRSRWERFAGSADGEDDALETGDPAWPGSHGDDVPAGLWEPEEDGEPDEGGSPGFAEALFGTGGRAADLPVSVREPAVRTEVSDDGPVVNPFAQARASRRPVDYDDPVYAPPPAGGRWVIWLMVILIAAIIGGLAAQLSGLAFWQ